MNNVKRLSILLLLSIGAVSLTFAKGRNNCDDRCDTRRCDDRNDCKTGCDDECTTSTFFRPRSITLDLTYRNNLTFYNRYHQAACNFFTWDNAIIFQRSRDNGHIGAGFLGDNPILVAETGEPNVNSLNLGLGVINNNNPADSGNFSEEYGICPRRSVVAWLPQLYFNLDCFAQGMWFDVSFAVARAKHELRQSIGADQSNLDEAKNVAQALDARNTYWADCDTHTGVDDVAFRFGYDWRYCANDHIGAYLIGVAPTGKAFNNARWFAPLVGQKHGALGFGLTGDYTIYECDADNTDVVFQTELMYLFRLRHDENRRFDLVNGPLSRWLLIANADTPTNPQTNLVDILDLCVRVEPRHNIQWWANFHYQWCNWAAEFSYNLWYRDRERIDCAPNVDFGDTGIYSQTCRNPRTSNSKAEICTLFDNSATATQDENFTRLTVNDINFCSGAAQRVLTHKISGAFAYNDVWCDCYPYNVGFGAGYEFASDKDKRHALEGWHVYGKFNMSY